MLSKRMLLSALSGVLALTLVSLGASLNGANAAALATTDAPPATAAALDRILALSDADKAAFAASVPVTNPLTGHFVPSVDPSAARVAVELNALRDSGLLDRAAQELYDIFGRNSGRTVDEFFYWVGQGNSRLIGLAGVWTLLIIPGILNCRVGDPLCIVSLLFFGVGFSANIAIGAAFNYLQAVMELPT